MRQVKDGLKILNVWNGLVETMEPGLVAVDRLPIYLQHAGHSRSVVGVQIRKRSVKGTKYDVFLLVLDSSIDGAELTAGLASGKWKSLLKRSPGTFRHKQYSLLHLDEWFDSVVLFPGDDEYERLKDINYLAQLHVSLD